jgi:hypothetical protein
VAVDEIVLRIAHLHSSTFPRGDHIAFRRIRMIRAEILSMAGSSDWRSDMAECVIVKPSFQDRFHKIVKNCIRFTPAPFRVPQLRMVLSSGFLDRKSVMLLRDCGPAIPSMTIKFPELRCQCDSELSGLHSTILLSTVDAKRCAKYGWKVRQRTEGQRTCGLT